MSPGDLQAWSCAARGWARRFLFVLFSYTFRAILKMDLKLDEEVDAGADET
jgi:hypothetical protein